MQVSNNQSPNFGMALKIKPGVAEHLRKTPMEYIQHLEQIGENLKDCKRVNLVLEEAPNNGGFYDVIDLNGPHRYYGVNNLKTDNRGAIEFDTTWKGANFSNVKYNQRFHAVHQLQNPDVANAAVEKLNALSGIERSAEMSKILNDAKEYQIQVEDMEKVRKEAVSHAVDGLMSKFKW
jgi:hypothetical protein